MLKEYHLNVLDLVKQTYMNYFEHPTEINLNLWIPNLAYKRCAESLRFWTAKAVIFVCEYYRIKRQKAFQVDLS